MTQIPPSRCYHIWTIGCQMNEADARKLGARIEALGWRETDDAERADLLILNTCVVRRQAEDKAYGRLARVREMKEKRPDLRVALMGCLVGRGGSNALRERFPFVDVFMPPSECDPLVRFLESEPEPSRVDACAGPESGHRLPERLKGAVRANVPVVLGCSHACTYCIIPYRRGREHSRPPGEILDEIRALASQGVREVALLGQIVDRYGLDRDDGYTLARLLREAAGVEGIFRVRFLTSHPNYLGNDVIETVAEHPRICPHFEVPFQAGSDTILARMRRGYTAEQYRALVGRIRARIPDAAIHTDVIVGFPGETEADFDETLRLINELRLDKAHVARYSPRPQTWAARRLEDHVPAAEKEHRRVAVDTAQTRILAEKNAERVGKTVEVLVEARDARSGRMRGRTPDDRIVFFEDAREPVGEQLRIRVDWAGPFSLIGTRADEDRDEDRST